MTEQLYQSGMNGSEASAVMLKGYKFRIFSDDKQTAVIKQTIGNCRWLYNYFLDERETFYKLVCQRHQSSIATNKSLSSRKCFRG